MTDETPAPWESTSLAAKIKSLFLRGRSREAENLIRGANAEAAKAAETEKPAT